MNTVERGIESRLEELESKLAFQDDLIESLNEIITRQDLDLVRLEQRVRSLAERLTDIAESAPMSGGSSGHEVPPHY
jgi:SlyX protein